MAHENFTMEKRQIKDGISWIGAIDYDLRIFDIIMYTEFGTTYNSYIVEGSEKTAIFETVKHTFTEEYIEFLQKNMDTKKIDYIVVDHTEPDHVGTVGKLLEIAPNAVVVGSAAAIKFLEQIANRTFASQIVKEGDEISLGDKTLRFIMAPFLHWPDSIYTYVVEDEVLFTCDSFGAHYAHKDVFLSTVTKEEEYKSALQYYFTMIFGPFTTHMLTAIEKIENLPIDVVCPGHGPILDRNPREIIEICKNWSIKEVPKNRTIVVPYVSAYGYTRSLAEEIAKGLRKTGEFEVKVYDMVYANQEEVLYEIGNAEGVIFGSPTINGDALPPIMDILLKLNPIVHGGKLAAGFGSFGWSGEAVGNLNRRMKEIKFRVMEGMKVNFKPTEEDLENARIFGERFVDTITGKEVFVSFETPGNLTHEVNEKQANKPQTDEHGRPIVKKWICTICNEVFEGVEPPEICAACGASREQFIEYIEEDNFENIEVEGHIVIVGNGIAGVTAAETIRKNSDTAKITIIDREDHTVYYKPMLSKFITSEDMPDAFFIHDKHWYERKNITVKYQSIVKEIATKEKAVILENGAEINYDKLIIAAGSDSFKVPIPNADANQVFFLRTYDDALRIKEVLKEKKKIAVIGGGLLGLEAAGQIADAGYEVNVIEIADRILPRQLDEVGAKILEAAITNKGIKLHMGASVKEIQKDEENHVTGVLLSTDEVVDVEFVLISAGVRSNVGFGSDAGLACDKGIVVDQYMLTTDENIYAAGDVANYAGANYSIWPEAIAQGEIAGSNALQSIANRTTQKEYDPIVVSTVFNGMGCQIFSIGEINAEASAEVSVLSYQDTHHKTYKKLIFRKDKIVGAIIMGDNKQSVTVLQAIKNGATIKDVRDVL